MVTIIDAQPDLSVVGDCGGGASDSNGCCAA
jgi:hypothetical protein